MAQFERPAQIPYFVREFNFQKMATPASNFQQSFFQRKQGAFNGLGKHPIENVTVLR